MTTIRKALAALTLALVALVGSATATPAPIASAALTGCTINYYIDTGSAVGRCTVSTNYAPYTTQAAMFVQCRQPRPYSGRQWVTSGWVVKNQSATVRCQEIGTGWYAISGSGYWVFR